MMKSKQRRPRLGLLALSMSVMPAWSLAADWEVTGVVREEVAVPVGGGTNPMNQYGNVFNGVQVPNTGLGPFLAPGASPATLGRPAAQAGKNDLNLLATRLELNIDGKINDNFALHGKLRGFYDAAYSAGVLKGGNGYAAPFGSGNRGGPFETAGRAHVVDIPTLFADYNSGPLWLRVGQQQIAWGEAIYFRALDVPNGLDLRRHSSLDVAAEEYSDKRASSLGVRGSWRVNNDWEVEGYGKRFQPTILPGKDSPYNPVAGQFNVQQDDGYAAVKNKFDIAARVKGKLGDYGVQAMATSRINPDGVLRWTNARGTGALPGTSFQSGTGAGVYSAAEWFHYAGAVGLDGVRGLETALNEFPATQALGTAAIAGGCGATVSAAQQIRFTNAAQASCVLDTFFDPVVGTGNLVGHLTREYKREQVLGFSVNRVFEGEPNTLMDQLLGRFELSYAPRRSFTNPSLSSQYITQSETQFAFIVEKNHKFSSEFPATYVVGQWLHKSASDLFGRHLSGLGGSSTPGSPPGVRGFNALALAIQQPSPTLEWRGDLTVLTDLRGGWLIQPGVKWRPSKSMQFDLYANVFRSNGGNDDFASNLKGAREVFARASFYF